MSVMQSTARLALVGLCLVTLLCTARADPVTGQGSWESTLFARDLDGDKGNGPEAFYDSTLDVTWLRAATGAFMTWAQATAWAEQVRFGVGGWRLPTMIDTASPGCDFSVTGGTDCGYNVQTKSGNPTQFDPGQTVFSELAHLWYVTLGNKALHAPGTGESYPPGWGLTNTGEFENLLVGQYWTNVLFTAEMAWQFHSGFGYQDNRQGTLNPLYAIAVRSGDVHAVGLPGTLALTLIGLVCAVPNLRPRLARNFAAR